MSDPFKPYPELVIDRDEDGTCDRITTKGGSDVFVIVANRSLEELERLVECWNALRKIAFPTAHLDATEEYVKRLEKLRRDAVAATHEAAQ